MDEHLLRFDKKKSFVFIDCETLNLCLSNINNLPWQIAMISVKGDFKQNEKNYYLRWNSDLKISDDAARITRYSQLTVDRLGLPPKDVFPTIKDWLGKCDYIVGHNILNFDIYLLKDLYELMGEDYTPIVNKIIDTNALARGIKYSIPFKPKMNLLEYQYKMNHTIRKGVKTNLTALGKEYGIEHDYDNLHDAIVDLELNLKVWNKIKWQVEI